jgi:peptidoglycan/LPS O-acetylase OafA/YrhL
VQRRQPGFAYGAGMGKSANPLVAWQRRALWLSGAVLLLSGAAWLAIHYGRSDDALPSPLEAWLMRLHGFASFAALFIFGALAAGHVPQGWRLSDESAWASQRTTGLLLCVLAGSLAVSAYLLYYFAPDSIRPSLGWVHSGLGATMAVLVLVHRRRD